MPVRCQDFLKEEAIAKHIFKWKNNLEREEAIRGNGKIKLRTYQTFKSNYFTEKYLHIKSLRLRSAMAKFRCGIAPINIEIGRYYGISANERFCYFCSDEVEDEIHVLLYCSMYNCVRDQLFKHAVYINNTFMSLNDSEKPYFIFTNNDVGKAIIFA